jgi:hypothetical protein
MTPRSRSDIAPRADIVGTGVGTGQAKIGNDSEVAWGGAGSKKSIFSTHRLLLVTKGDT